VRRSYRVKFPGGTESSGRVNQLAGIIDRPDDVDDPPIAVFSHCFTCNKDLKAIVRISRALADAGIAVLRYDMTGLGGSDGEFSNTNFSTNLADLQAAIRFAGQELGQVDVLIGHSFGGAASLAVASGAQPSPAVVITLAAPSDTQHLAWLLASKDPQIDQTGVGQVEIGGVRWSITRQMLDDFRAHQLTDLIPRVQAATLLFHSLLDETVGYDHALRLMGLIQGSPASSAPVSLCTLADADHLLVNQDDLSFVASTASAFIHRYR
jgi:putative redox protein